MSTKCEWNETGDGIFEASCGYATVFNETESGPGWDKDFNFCCKCGKKIQQFKNGEPIIPTALHPVPDGEGKAT